MAQTHSDELADLRSAVRSIAKRTSGDATPLPDQSGDIPKAVTTALAAMGLLSPHETDIGGQGVPDALAMTVIAEELGRVDAGTALALTLGAHAAIIVDRCGTREQRARTLGDDSVRGTLLLFEGFGRSPLELETRVQPDGDGWLVEGVKTSVPRIEDSDFAVVLARSPERGLAALLLPVDAVRAGVRSSNTANDDPVLGARAARTTTVELTGASGAEMLGEPCDDIHIHRLVAAARLGVAAIVLGTADAAIHYAAGYAATREAFGRTISEFQGVAFPLVDAEIGVDAARLAVQDIAVELDSFTDAVALVEATNHAVAGANQAGCIATATAVNTLGGHGYLTDHPVERWYRDAAALAAIDFDPLLTDWSGAR